MEGREWILGDQLGPIMAKILVEGDGGLD